MLVARSFKDRTSQDLPFPSTLRRAAAALHLFAASRFYDAHPVLSVPPPALYAIALSPSQQDMFVRLYD